MSIHITYNIHASKVLYSLCYHCLDFMLRRDVRKDCRRPHALGLYFFCDSGEIIGVVWNVIEGYIYSVLC